MKNVVRLYLSTILFTSNIFFRYGDIVVNSESSLSIQEFFVYRVTSHMRRWSPAYLINECIMFYFEGCIFSHVYLLFWVTLLITQVHKLVVKSVYCYEYST